VPRLSFSQISREDLGPFRGRNGIALGAIALVAIAVVVIIATLPGSSKGASTPGKVAGSTTVERRNLVATDTEAGTLSYANPQTVFDRLTGTITWLPAVGALIKPGHTLFKVSGAPVVLFNGNTPAYRDLDSSDTNGADIYELNADLKALGFNAANIVVNDTWQAATTTGVEDWQASEGMTETGTVTFGQIVFLPGAQRITTINTVLGSDGGASSSGAGTGSGASLDNVAAPRPQFVSLDVTPATTTTAATAPADVPAAPASTSSASMAAAAATTTTTTTTSSATPAPTTTTTTTTSSTTTPSSKTTTCKNANNSGQKTTSQKHAKNTTSHPSTCKPTTAAELLALLKAETLELQKSLSSSGTPTGGKGGGSGSAGASGGGSGGSGGSAGSGSSGSGASGSGGSGGSGSGGTGGSGGTAQAVIDTTSTKVIVTVDLDATKQSEATVGEPVTVQMPSGNIVNGTITAVSPIAQSSSSGSGSGSGSGGGGSGNSTPSATIPVTVTLKGKQPLTGLDQAAVSVNFQQQKANNVLSVPVTALLASAGGGYAVQEATAPHKVLPVTPGLFAAGYVQISGADIYPGLQVTDSQG
jgi:hypothetical protein